MEVKAAASTILILTCVMISVIEGVKVSAGPSTTTQKIGSRFVLRCTITEQTADDFIFWRLYPHNEDRVLTLTSDKTAKNPRYELEPNTYNLVVKNATYQDDGEFRCEAGSDAKGARVYIWDKPRSMSLEWEGLTNGPDAVKAGNKYNLQCVSINSHPPATHRIFKGGSELNTSKIVYTFQNSSDAVTGYGNTTSVLTFTPTKADIEQKVIIECVADLWTVKNASSAYFNINSAPRFTSYGTTSAVMVVIAVILNFT